MMSFQKDMKEKELPPIPIASTSTLNESELSQRLRVQTPSLNFKVPPPRLNFSKSLSNVNEPKQNSRKKTNALPPLKLNATSLYLNENLSSPAPYSVGSTEDSNLPFVNDELDSANTTPSATDGATKPVSLSLPFKNVNKGIVVNQKSDDKILSARTKNQEPPAPFMISKSLNRRNIKKLTLNSSDMDSINGDENKNKTENLIPTGKMNPISNPAFSLSSPCLQLQYKDPDKKATTEELIENIQNLELGLEYQLPIRAEDLIMLKKLGSGQSGTVSKVLHLPTQKTMARKIVHLETKELIQSQIIRELRIMHECDSPFIVGFYGTFLHEGNVVICMEYVDCGSLEHIFKITGPFPEFMLKHVAYSVLSGLIYLYDQHRIIHRDVKPSNVLLNSKGNVKLCDFGVSRELINSMADTFVGTSTYMSPERIQGGVYSVKGDVWSLGIMLYELASNKLAFSTNDDPALGPESILELLQRIVNEKPPSLSVKEDFSPEICDFVSLCLKKEKQRSSPWDLMMHPFLSDFLEEDGIRVNAKYRGDIKKWAKNVRRVQKGKPMRGD